MIIPRHAQNGIGSNSCGPELQTKYKFCEENFEFEFTMLLYPKK